MLLKIEVLALHVRPPILYIEVLISIYKYTYLVYVST